MSANQHRNLLDSNRHNPLGFESAENDTFLGKNSGVSYGDRSGNLVWNYMLETFVLSADVVRTGGFDYIRIPYKFYVTQIRASIFTVGSGITSVDVLENGTSILSTSLTIDAGEKTSTTAAIPVVISDYQLADDSEITVNITGVGEGREVGTKIKIYLSGYRMTS